MPKMFFSRYDFLMILCSYLHQSTILHLFVRKISFIWPFFKKSLQEVQSIHCLVLNFWGQNTAISKYDFFGNTYASIPSSEHHCAESVAEKTAWFCLFRKVAPKSTIYTLSRSCIFVGQKLVFFEERLFWSHLCFDSLFRAPLCTVWAEKNTWFGLFSKSCSKKYSLYTVSICIFEAWNCYFLRKRFFNHTYARFFIRAPLCTGWAEKNTWFGLFSKSCSKKYSLYTVSIWHFWGQRTAFSKERLFWSYWCFDTLSEHRCAQVGPKKLLDLAFFRKVAPKSTVYTQCLDLHFWWPESDFFRRFDFFDANLFVRFFFQSIIVHSLGRKNCLIWPFFRKVAPKPTVYTLSRLAFLMPKKFFSRYDFLMTFCSILVQSTILHLFGEKTASFGLFSKSCNKMYSLSTVSFCIFEARNCYFEIRLFW